MIKKYLLVRNAVAILAAPLLWIAPAVNAQSSSPSSQESRTSQNSDSEFQDQSRREEMVRFNQFLESHRDIDEQLRRDPSLANSQQFLQAHPALQSYLQDHPMARQDLAGDPNGFMKKEQSFDRREDARENRDDRDVRGDRDARGDNDRGQPEDASRRLERARFDQFLDSHREISEQLRRDPSLANNQQFLQNHPELQSYLNTHPMARQDLASDPNAFMRQEERYDRREDANRDADARRFDNRQDNDARQDDRDRDRDADRRDNDRRTQLAQFDRFLDTHRETAEQLRRDPSQVKNQQFLQNHPALQTYLQQHPDIRQSLDQNPNAFMRQENRFDNNEDARNRDFDRDDARRNNNDRDNSTARDNDRRDNDARDRDADNRNDRDRDNGYRADNDARQDARNRDHGQVVSFDQFLDKHAEIAEQLRRDPSLAKNQQFVSNHPALQAYLQDHQGVREQLYQDPNGFMQQEKTYESRENGMGRNGNGMNREQYSFGQFLGTHSSMSEELSKNPSLLKNREYMSSHPELQAYMKAHPDAQSQMAKDPDSFLKASQHFSSSTKTGTTTGTTSTTGTTKTTTPDATKPAETPKPPKQQ